MSEITSKDLQECILAEINELLARERANIVKRAQARLKKVKNVPTLP